MKKRFRGIGGSEISAILGLDQYTSPYKIWLRKTGRGEEFRGNKFTLAGNLLEGAVMEYFERESGNRLIKSSAQRFFVHPKYQHAIGYVDMMYFSRGTGKGVVEGKVTQTKIDQIPSGWFAQLQWYMGISGTHFGSLAWLERGLDFYFKEYEFDDDFFKYMVDKADEFIKAYIIPDIPPDPINARDTEMIYSRHLEGKVLEANQGQKVIHEELKTLTKEINERQKKVDGMIEQIKMSMKDAEALADSGKFLFSWRKPKPSMVLNKNALKEKHPKLHDRFLVERETHRRFLIK